MVTSHAPKPARSHLRKMHAAERGWSNLLNMWHVCANTACRRARCCRGNPSYCYRHNYPQLPEAVKDWFALIGEFQAAGLPFEEAWAGLEKCGVLAEFVSWHNLAHGKRGGALSPENPGKESENTEESHGKPRHLNRRQLRERKTHDHDDTHRDSGAHRPTSERRCRRGSRRADCPRRQHEKRAAGRDRRAAAGLARYRALCRLRDAEIDPRNLAFAPQYPLWTDGAAKRRWISLPPGTAIDASDPENWVFPGRAPGSGRSSPSAAGRSRPA